MKLLMAERTHTDTPGLCWQFGIASKRSAWITHVSIGGPVWWKPNASRKRYAGITEWRAGWLLMAVQIARKPHRD